MYQVMPDENNLEANLKEVMEATPQFPLLGYTVIATLDSAVEISHVDLLAIATPLGFAVITPPQAEPAKIIQRAMTAFLKDVKSGENDAITLDDEGKALLRKIKTPDKDRVIFALVQEKTLLEHLGLDYLTDLRVFFLKGKPGKPGEPEEPPMLVATMGDPKLVGKIDPLTYSANAQEEEIRTGIQRWYDYYSQIYKSDELSRWINAIIEHIDLLAGKRMRDAGGVHFVRYDKRPELIRLKQLIEKDLPTTTGMNTSRLIHIPIISEPHSQAQVSITTHDAFLQKLEAFEKNMAPIITANTGSNVSIKPKWMEERITQYTQLQDELKLYDMLLGARRKEIEERLGRLSETAKGLISAYSRAKAEKKTQATPEEK
jgi:hypothetical protein